MKSFSDTNSDIQQRRLKGSTFIIRIELFRQFSGKITSVDDGTKEILVPGDATAFISAENYILIPLHNMESTYLVSSISYSAGNDETTVTVSSGTLDDTMLSLEIARRYTVSFGDVERLIEMSPINFKTEGESLNEFLSDDVTFRFDNGDGFFGNKDGTGIFDDDDIFWTRVFTGYKHATDRILFFGGIVDEESLSPDRSQRTFGFTAYGHIKELERYPGYYISDTSGEFVKINGLTIKSFEAGAGVQEGVKKFKYEPFSSGRIQGISIKKVSSDIEPGLKLLEFRYPYYWRFDRGPWKEVADLGDVNGDGDAKLYAKGGSGSTLYALVNFGDGDNLNSFPDEDDLLLIQIGGNFLETKEDVANKIVQSGKPVVTFDDGEQTALFFNLPRVLVYDDSVTTYTDLADSAATEDDAFTILDDTADELIIVSHKPFWGLEFIFDTPFGSDAGISLQYSVGGTTFSAAMSAGSNGLSEGTSGFTEDGEILWNKADGWRENFIEIDSSTEYHGYMIKITRSGGSGSCALDLVRPVIRCRGKRGDFLNLKTNYRLLTTESKEDTVIIKQQSGTYVAATWYQNTALKAIVEKVLDGSTYFIADRDIDDLKIISATAVLNIWGRTPKYSYTKKPSCVFIDGEDVYIGVDDEVWKTEEQGETALVVKLNRADYTIRGLQKVSNDLFIIADELLTVSSGEDSFVNCYKYDLSSGILTMTRSGANYNSGRYFFRDGDFEPVNNERIIGWGLGYWGGENIVIPFKQETSLAKFDENPTTSRRAGLEIAGTTTLVLFYYTAVKSRFYAPQGYYGIVYGNAPSVEKAGFRFTFGQQGTLLYDTAENSFYFFRLSTSQILEGADTSKTWQKHYYCRFINYMHQPACGFIQGGNVFLGSISWYETNVGLSFQGNSYSYLSRYLQSGKVRDWTMLFREAGGSYTDLTTTLNAGGASIGFNNAMTFYLGSDKKFLSAFFDIASSSLTETIVVEYWDGSSWTALTLEEGTAALTQDGHFTWHMPYDWVKDDLDTINSVSVDSTDRWWVRLRCTTSGGGTATVAAIWNSWPMLWDSQVDNSANYDTFTPLWMCYNTAETAIHGCMFERDEQTIYGFEFIYFVFDLTTETLYITQSGSNFTFNPSLLIKDFAYNAYDEKVYAICEDIRYKEQPAFLISATYAGGTITLTKESDIVAGEWGSAAPMATRSSDGAVFGLTRDKSFYLWQYAKEFYPRLLLADFGDLDYRQICVEAAKTVSQIFTVHSDRTVLFYERSSYGGEKTLLEYEHLVDVLPVEAYKHTYEGIEVTWSDPYTGESGTEEYGDLGWRRKVLKISGKFIQSRFLAAAVAEKYAAYFLVKRGLLQVETTALIQTEERDRIKVIASSKNYDVDRDTWWLINEIELDPETLVMKIKGVS